MRRTLSDGSYQYYGFCVDVLDELSNKLNNFGYEIFELDHKDVKTNGKGRIWDDIINQLKVGVCSISGSDSQQKVQFLLRNTFYHQSPESWGM